LEQLLSGDNVLDVDMEPPPIKPSEDAVYVTDNARTAAGSEALDAAEIESEDSEADIIADVPDDPDEAMAWLEQLAARQGADLEELPSVSEAEAELEMPDWMAQDLEELTAEPDLELTEPVEEDDDIDSELPDWLDEEPRGRVLGQTDWLRALPEVDVDTWLSAEEEATITGSTDEIILPDTGPLTSRLETTPAEEEIDEDVLFEPVMEPSTGAYSVDEAKLDMAQQSLADGRINEAISQFKELVAAGSGMMSIIAELEQAAEAHPQAPALSQVLGDAYMRNGQLQKALASYRAALDQM
jgi:tetratricopeptide (TPR) repeat protein